uniref:Uncharacterized protein n=1 Tax=Melopsittacus undulatus TaxID=13146 RepID=A0A8V5H9M6_MELUD
MVWVDVDALLRVKPATSPFPPPLVLFLSQNEERGICHCSLCSGGSSTSWVYQHLLLILEFCFHLFDKNYPFCTGGKKI